MRLSWQNERRSKACSKLVNGRESADQHVAGVGLSLTCNQQPVTWLSAVLFGCGHACP